MGSVEGAGKGCFRSGVHALGVRVTHITWLRLSVGRASLWGRVTHTLHAQGSDELAPDRTHDPRAFSPCLAVPGAFHLTTTSHARPRSFDCGTTAPSPPPPPPSPPAVACALAEGDSPYGGGYGCERATTSYECSEYAADQGGSFTEQSTADRPNGCYRTLGIYNSQHYFHNNGGSTEIGNANYPVLCCAQAHYPPSTPEPPVSAVRSIQLWGAANAVERRQHRNRSS